jgi:hypothetical protein
VLIPSKPYQPQYGILKSPERTPRSKLDKETDDLVSPNGFSSRVTFNFEKESGIIETEVCQFEDEADREIEAIMKNNESSGNDNQVFKYILLDSYVCSMAGYFYSFA